MRCITLLWIQLLFFIQITPHYWQCFRNFAHCTYLEQYVTHWVLWKTATKLCYCSIDPRGRPTVTAVSDHYFRTCCLYVRPSVRTFQNLAKQNKFQARTVIATGGTVGLAEWIIDDTHFLFFLYWEKIAVICGSLSCHDLLLPPQNKLQFKFDSHLFAYVKSASYKSFSWVFIET